MNLIVSKSDLKNFKTWTIAAKPPATKHRKSSTIHKICAPFPNLHINIHPESKFTLSYLKIKSKTTENQANKFSIIDSNESNPPGLCRLKALYAAFLEIRPKKPLPSDETLNDRINFFEKQLKINSLITCRELLSIGLNAISHPSPTGVTSNVFREPEATPMATPASAPDSITPQEEAPGKKYVFDALIYCPHPFFDKFRDSPPDTTSAKLGIPPVSASVPASDPTPEPALKEEPPFKRQCGFMSIEELMAEFDGAHPT